MIHRIRTWQELVNWVNEIGFLPLFANDITGFFGRRAYLRKLLVDRRQRAGSVGMA